MQSKSPTMAFGSGSPSEQYPYAVGVSVATGDDDTWLRVFSYQYATREEAQAVARYQMDVLRPLGGADYQVTVSQFEGDYWVPVLEWRAGSGNGREYFEDHDGCLDGERVVEPWCVHQFRAGWMTRPESGRW